MHSLTSEPDLGEGASSSTPGHGRETHLGRGDEKMDNGLKTPKTFRTDCQSDRMDGTA